MKKILSFVFLMFLFFCSKSDSTDAISSEENNSNLPETFGNWSPDFTNQTTNFNQTRTGSKGTNETREITVTSSDEVLLSIESKLLTDVNEDGDNFDITSQTITTFTASEGLGSFISSGTTLIKSDINIELKNAGQVDIDITSISTGEKIGLWTCRFGDSLPSEEVQHRRLQRGFWDLLPLKASNARVWYLFVEFVAADGRQRRTLVYKSEFLLIR